MDACCGLLKGGSPTAKLMTWVIWSAAVYGRLDDPSTLRFIQGLRRFVEESPDACVGKNKAPVRTLSQASGRGLPRR
jgi:hypothetical protein